MWPRTYAPIIAAAFVLWIVVSFLGGQGFSPLLVLIGVAALAYKRPTVPGPIYAWLIGLAVVWACGTAAWSPASEGLWSGNIASGDFSINAAGLRILGTYLLGGLAIAAALSIPPEGGAKSGKVLLGSIAFQGALIIVIFILMQQILELIYPGDPHKQLSEGRQNAMRMGNAFAIALALFLPAAWYLRSGAIWRIALIAAALGFTYIFQSVGSQTAVVSMGFMLLCFLIVLALPKTGFKWITGCSAAFIAAAPILLSCVTLAADKLGLSLPGSFSSRLYAWRYTIDKIGEEPLKGHGLEASSKWTDTFATRPDWLADLATHASVEKINIAPWEAFRIVPGHPHNMPLQIWAETGAIGALLAAGAIAMIGWRLPAPKDLRADVRLAAAGVMGATLPLASFAYSVWNEAFWAMIAVAVCGVILLSKMPARKKS